MKKLIFVMTLIFSLYGCKSLEKDKIYPHLRENPAEVMVKHIDIGKYDTRDQNNPSLILDQDKGESTYIKMGTLDILIDGGQNNNDGASYRAIEEVIKNNSEDQKLEYVFLTHPHADHFGGLMEVLKNYSIDYILESSSKYSTSGFRRYSALRDEQISKGTLFCSAKDALDESSKHCQKTLELAPDIAFTIFDTGYLEASQANPASLVILFDFFNIKYLFTGDAEKDQEAVYSSAVGKVDILKMPHHGTRNATEINLLTNCKPSNIIIQNGNNLGNQYGHPTSASINRIYQYDDEINIYPVTGGGFGSVCQYGAGNEKNCSFVPENSSNDFNATFDPNRFNERNGTITTIINPTGYKISSELSDLLEMSQTSFWKEHLNRSFSHK